MEPVQNSLLNPKQQWHKAQRKRAGEKSTSTVFLWGRRVVFEERAIFQNDAVIRMPREFAERPPEEGAPLFWASARPQHLFSSSRLHFTLALSWTFNRISNENIANVTKVVRPLVPRIFPESMVLREETFPKEEGSVSVLYIASPAAGTARGNVLFFASAENRLLMGSIAFSMQDADRLEPIALEMARSFRWTRKHSS